MPDTAPNPAAEKLLILIGEVRQVAANPDRMIDGHALVRRLEAIYKALTS